MKKHYDVVVIKKEEDISLVRRRADYAGKRDLQANDNNNAISRRHHPGGTVKVKCVICGKEFSTVKNSEGSRRCPGCRKS